MRDLSMKPLFSIITVVLNPPPDDLFLTVKSVLQQECGDWELIIKDGGSSSDSLAGVPEDPRVRIIAEADRGIFDAMNQGLRLANGRFICFLNAGDWFYDRTALRCVAEVIRRNPDAEFLYGDVAKPASRSGFERYPAELSRSYLFSHMICHQAWFVSLRYYNRPERYETDHPTGADRRFLLRMILQNRVRSLHVPRVIAGYRGGGISQKPENVTRGRQWADQLRRHLYPPREYRVLSLRAVFLKAVKRTIYDPFGWRIWRLIQRARAGQ
jgi:glycosyltransferase involved in cell wall biosynthesis